MDVLKEITYRVYYIKIAVVNMIYIGMTNDFGFEKRLKAHDDLIGTPKKYKGMYEDMAKYPYDFRTLKRGLTKFEALGYEIDYIRSYETVKNGYNTNEDITSALGQRGELIKK